LIYVQNGNTGKSVWVSADPILDDWTDDFVKGTVQSQPLPDVFPYIDWPLYSAEATPRPELVPPDIHVVRDQETGADRVLQLQLQARREGSMLELQIEKGPVRALEVAGKQYAGAELASTRERLILQFWTPHTAGAGNADVTLRLAPGTPLAVLLAEIQYASSATQSILPSSRPAGMAPYPFGWISDAVVVTRAQNL
jgi:hypothetical protein